MKIIFDNVFVVRTPASSFSFYTNCSNNNWYTQNNVPEVINKVPIPSYPDNSKGIFTVTFVFTLFFFVSYSDAGELCWGCSKNDEI